MNIMILYDPNDLLIIIKVPFDLLNNFGIEYLEVRGIDISPNEITGMSEHHIRFIDLFYLLSC